MPPLIDANNELSECKAIEGSSTEISVQLESNDEAKTLPENEDCLPELIKASLSCDIETESDSSHLSNHNPRVTSDIVTEENIDSALKSDKIVKTPIICEICHKEF